MKQGTQSWGSGPTQRDGVEGGFESRTDHSGDFLNTQNKGTGSQGGRRCGASDTWAAPFLSLVLGVRVNWRSWTHRRLFQLREPKATVVEGSDPVCRLLPCTICISACITKPMGNAWLLAIPNSGCLWCSFPLSYQHLHLLPSPVGSRHQQTPLDSNTSTSNTPENNSTVFFSREVRISAVFQASCWGVRYC